MDDSRRIMGPRLQNTIDEIVSSCPCITVQGPPPHRVVSTRISNRKKLDEVASDVITIDGTKFQHFVCKATGWSVTALLPRKDLASQIRPCRMSWLWKHGTPNVVLGDNEYNKEEFLDFLRSIDAQYQPTETYDYQANGCIESANRTLRNYYPCLRANDRKSPTADVVAEATMGKNLCKGGKLASSYKLIYGIPPLIMDELVQTEIHITTVDEENRRKAQQKIRKMLRSNVHQYEDIEIDDEVYFWRDQLRWLGPSPVVEIDDHKVIVLHNGVRNSSAHSRVRKFEHPPPADDETSRDAPLTRSPLTPSHLPPALMNRSKPPLRLKRTLSHLLPKTEGLPVP